MTDPVIPAGFTQHDWLELLGFTWKIENEGYEYASEHYAPSFDTPALQAIVADDDPRPLRGLYRQYYKALQAWQEAVGWQEVDRLRTAHLRQEKERREAHLLWAVHPGGNWDYAAHSDAFETREDAEKWIAGQDELVQKYGWKPWAGRLLHRTEPGADWTEVQG
ncbi:hypothetical protein [Streptomyces sp. NBC_01238]|uniref:hypothetical protein n=1 Tax=Streptomyces sp. NBC_01238 TaxID=2903791 RepID=UPI002F90811C